MKLAKQSLDAGLFTNNIDAMLRFYQEEVGLPFEELLPTGGGSRQHRHGLNGSVLKINESREPFPAKGPTGYQRLSISTDRVSRRTDLEDPDGNAVTLLPAGDGERFIEIEVAVANLQQSRRHYHVALGFEPTGEDAYRCGTTVIRLIEKRAQLPTEEMRAVGFRYLTVQVWDADAEYQQAVNQGARAGMPPRTLGSVARFGFVRDPGGNWLEISQRASLTGALPANPQ